MPSRHIVRLHLACQTLYPRNHGFPRQAGCCLPIGLIDLRPDRFPIGKPDALLLRAIKKDGFYSNGQSMCSPGLPQLKWGATDRQVGVSDSAGELIGPRRARNWGAH